MSTPGFWQNPLLQEIGSYLGLTGSPADRAAGRRTKPPNLTYDVDEIPPISATLLLSLQHVFVVSMGWINVVVFVTSVTGSAQQAANVIRMSMIASGLATMLQALRKGPVGSGYLCPMASGATYMASSIIVGKSAGIDVVFALTMLSGLFEAVISRLVRRLRALFPPEVTGLVVCMVGIELIAMACPRFFGYAGSGSVLSGRAAGVGIITLGAMVAPSVWGKGKIRLYPVLLGLLAGYGSALLLGVLSWPQLENYLSAPLFSLPHRQHLALSFAPAFIIAFMIASLSSMLKTIGDITVCQKINDAGWKRTEMRSVSGGILAGATCTTLSGLLGGMGQSTFTSSVGLSIATGATSRAVAYPTGLLLIALAFFPKLAAVFAGMPAPAMGAMLVYVACFMIVRGIQVITSRMLDSRKTFVVGIPLIFGLSVEIVPQIYQGFPALLRPLFTSSLALSTIAVVLLNMLFRIGIAKRQQIQIACGPEASDAIFGFMGRQGAAWGMRPEVATAATYALDEVMTALQSVPLRSPTVQVTADFDEFKLEIDVDYDGPPLDLPGAPPSFKQLAAKGGEVALARFMVRHYADDVKVMRRDGQSRVHMHFEH